MPIRAFLGLGNPGAEYEKTYHNVGAFGVGLLELDSAHKDKDYPNLVFIYDIGGYMNVIGTKVRQFIKRDGYKPEEVMIAHDDSDLLIGEYKLSFGGGSAGHKGIQSVIDNLKTENFWRLRIGVRDPMEKTRKKAGDFVLQKWSKADEGLFKKALTSAWEELKTKKLI